MPPPSPGAPGVEPIEVITLALIVEGDVATFDKVKFKLVLADSLGGAVKPTDIVVTVTAASINVKAKIITPSDPTVKAATLSSLKAITADPAAASAALGVTVEKIPTAPAVVTLVMSENDMNELSVGSFNAVPIIGGSLSGALIALLVLVGRFWFVKTRRGIKLGMKPNQPRKAEVDV